MLGPRFRAFGRDTGVPVPSFVMKLLLPSVFIADKWAAAKASMMMIPKRQSKNRHHNGDNNQEVIEVNFCYTAWIAMCLGFLFIWSSVISLVFIVEKLEESHTMQRPFEMFLEQERIGRIMFSVGQEMLFTVDSLVSIQLNLSDAQELAKSVNFTWDLTDDDIEEVKGQLQESGGEGSDLAALIRSFETKLESIRSNLSLATDHPLTMIDSYKLIFDLAEQYAMDRNHAYSTAMSSSGGSHWRLVRALVAIQNAPYSLFIKGMNRRFIELAYGTIYHIGPQLLNRTDAETEVANYFYYFYTSHELIETAFSWDSRIRHQYMELLRNDNQNQNNQKKNRAGNSGESSRLTGREYTRFVTDVVAYLLRAKDVLNVGFREMLADATGGSTRNPTMFYAIIAAIYLIVLVLCATFFVLFIRNAKIKETGTQLPGSSATLSTDMDRDDDDRTRDESSLHSDTYQQTFHQHPFVISRGARVGTYQPMPIQI